MKRFFLVNIMAWGLLSCQSNDENVMTVQGNVEGLKRGTIYLQRFEADGSIKNIDSVVAEGKGDFFFQVPLESPEIFGLLLSKKDNKNFENRIVFFGEAKTITINTHNETFDLTAQISGSDTQKLFEQYNQTLRKFSSKNTEYLAEQLQAIKDNNLVLADSISKLSNKNRVRQYLYSINFALNNKESYIAPYIALSQSEGIAPKYLDSIYKSLPKEIANSKYGKLLKIQVDSLQK